MAVNTARALGHINGLVDASSASSCGSTPHDEGVRRGQENPPEPLH